MFVFIKITAVSKSYLIDIADIALFIYIVSLFFVVCIACFEEFFEEKNLVEHVKEISALETRCIYMQKPIVLKEFIEALKTLNQHLSHFLV